jgi:hypothetical protein
MNNVAPKHEQFFAMFNVFTIACLLAAARAICVVCAAWIVLRPLLWGGARCAGPSDRQGADRQ